MSHRPRRAGAWGSSRAIQPYHTVVAVGVAAAVAGPEYLLVGTKW